MDAARSPEAGTAGHARSRNTMSSEPTDVDTSRLDELAKIASEQAGLRDLTDRAKAFRDRAVEVCERVVRDYRDRIAALEEQARALREKARGDLSSLAGRHQQARLAVERARFEQQEVDFRYEIGELGKNDYPERRKAVDEELARREAEFNAVDALKRRFVDALKDVPPPPDLGQPAADSAQAPLGEIDEPPPEEREPAGSAADNALISSQRLPPTPGEMTTFLPPLRPTAGSIPSREPTTERIPLVPPPPRETGEPQSAPAEENVTVAIAPAVLHEEQAEGEGAVHQLSFITTIGRTPDNQIAVPEAEVSRHHARITLTATGFVLEDLRSGNGTFLNGERIGGEQPLKDEDRVRIGSRTFVFRVQ
jgi:hypothetical protein